MATKTRGEAATRNDPAAVGQLPSMLPLSVVTMLGAVIEHTLFGRVIEPEPVVENGVRWWAVVRLQDPGGHLDKTVALQMQPNHYKPGPMGHAPTYEFRFPVHAVLEWVNPIPNKYRTAVNAEAIENAVRMVESSVLPEDTAAVVHPESGEVQAVITNIGNEPKESDADTPVRVPEGA